MYKEYCLVLVGIMSVEKLELLFRLLGELKIFY